MIPPPLSKSRGFTLIEMALMIAIGAALFIGIGPAAQNLAERAIENRNYLIALNLAKWQMAIMMNSSYPAVAAETEQTADPAFPDFVPTQEVVSADTNGAHSLREVRIRVRHGSSSGPVLVLLHTYRSDVITFGNGS